jgi:hypothetical protein
MDTGPPVRIGVLVAILVGIAVFTVGVINVTKEHILVGVPLIVSACGFAVVTWSLSSPRARTP